MSDQRNKGPSGGSTKAGQEPVAWMYHDPDNGVVKPFVTKHEAYDFAATLKGIGWYVVPLIPADTKAGLPGAAQAGTDAWRPIESAPRGRTTVLLTDGASVTVGWYGSGCWQQAHHPSLEGNPTHWMPLPAAPATEEEKP